MVSKSSRRVRDRLLLLFSIICSSKSTFFCKAILPRRVFAAETDEMLLLFEFKSIVARSIMLEFERVCLDLGRIGGKSAVLIPISIGLLL